MTQDPKLILNMAAPTVNVFQSLTFNLKATAKPRHEELEGRDHLVVPCIMAKVGVLPGSGGPLFYPAEELSRSVPAWNMKPVTVYHPTDSTGKGISAATLEVINKRKVGILLNTRFEDDALKTEVWLDVEKAKVVDNRVLEFIEESKVMEVSIGLFTDNVGDEGEFKGTKFNATATNYRPDHLALLPDQIGACSVADGAGLLRNAAQANTAEALLAQRHVLEFNELSHNEIWRKLNDLVRPGTSLVNPSSDVWVDEVFESFFIYRKGDRLFHQDYKVKKGEVSLEGTATEVERVIRFKTMDGKFIGNFNEKGTEMNKEQMVAELIKNGKAEEADKEHLMKLSEKTLQGMLQKEEAPKTNQEPPKVEAPKVEVKTEEVKTNADPKQEQPVTVEQYIAQAPAGIRDMLNTGLMVHNAKKAEMVAKIKANKGNRFTDAQLEAKELGELQAILDLVAAAAPVQNKVPGAPAFLGLGEPAPTDNKVEALPLPSIDFGKK